MESRNIFPLSQKPLLNKPEAGVDPDAAAGDGGELTPKQEPFDDSAAVVTMNLQTPAADSEISRCDSAAAIYPAADKSAGYLPLATPAAMDLSTRYSNR